MVLETSFCCPLYTATENTWPPKGIAQEINALSVTPDVTLTESDERETLGRIAVSFKWKTAGPDVAEMDLT